VREAENGDEGAGKAQGAQGVPIARERQQGWAPPPPAQRPTPRRICSSQRGRAPREVDAGHGGTGMPPRGSPTMGGLRARGGCAGGGPRRGGGGKKQGV